MTYWEERYVICCVFLQRRLMMAPPMVVGARSMAVLLWQHVECIITYVFLQRRRNLSWAGVTFFHWCRLPPSSWVWSTCDSVFQCSFSILMCFNMCVRACITHPVSWQPKCVQGEDGVWFENHLWFPLDTEMTHFKTYILALTITWPPCNYCHNFVPIPKFKDPAFLNNYIKCWCECFPTLLSQQLVIRI